MSILRSHLIRLAYNHPEFRDDLLPLITADESDADARFEEGKPADPTENMSPKDKAKWDKYHGKVDKLGNINVADLVCVKQRVAAALRNVGFSMMAVHWLKYILKETVSLMQDTEVNSPDIDKFLETEARRIVMTTRRMLNQAVDGDEGPSAQ